MFPLVFFASRFAIGLFFGQNACSRRASTRAGEPEPWLCGYAALRFDPPNRFFAPLSPISGESPTRRPELSPTVDQSDSAGLNYQRTASQQHYNATPKLVNKILEFLQYFFSFRGVWFLSRHRRTRQDRRETKVARRERKPPAAGSDLNRFSRPSKTGSSAQRWMMCG